MPRIFSTNHKFKIVEYGASKQPELSLHKIANDVVGCMKKILSK